MPMPTLWSPKFRLNTATDLSQLEPSVISLKDGTFFAVWSSEATTVVSGEIRGQRFDASGNPLGDELLISSTPTESFIGVPAIEVLQDGRFVVAWEYAVSPANAQKDIRARIFNPDGTAYDRGGPGGTQDFLVNSSTASDQLDISIAALDDGGFIITFDNHSQSGTSQVDVRARAFDDKGQAVGDDFVVNARTAENQSNSSIATLRNGNYVVVYEDSNGNGDIRGRIFTHDGEPLPGPEFVMPAITEGEQADPMVIALSNGRFVVVWNDANGDGSVGGIKAQIFEADGTKYRDEFIINQTTEGIQTARGAVALSDGGFAVVYEDGSSTTAILLTTFDNEGSRVGSEIQIEASDENQPSRPIVTELADGRLAVTWQESSTVGQAEDVYGKIVDARFAAINLSGTSFDDQYIGTNFGDRLGGAAGADRLRGEGGDDTLDGGAGADVLDGGAGFDFASFASATSGVTASLAGGGGDSFTGIEGIIGSAYGDTLIGNGTADLRGGLGADTYQVKAGDGVTENAGSGTDTVIASGSYSLSASAEVEMLMLSGLSSRMAADLTGSNTANAITGHAGANTLKGEGGNDLLKAASGNDRVYGGTGDDKLYGGLGNDRLYGGTGSDQDIFVFDTRPNKSTNVDRVYDFNPRYDTFQLDNAVFTKLGTGSAARPKKFSSDMFVKSNKAQDAEDRVIYDRKTGALYYDQDGTGSKAQVKIATLNKNLALTHNDFFVI
jgi:serralysin